MRSAAYNRIVIELTAQPKQRVGFDQRDFAALEGDERRVVLDRLMSLVEEGWGAQQLEWLLGDDYVATLQRRLNTLPRGSHGRVFLPYFIYLKTRDKSVIKRMMNAVIEADPEWDRRRDAVDAYLRTEIGQAPLFWDFCRYIILNVPERRMKKAAMLWLAQEKGYSPPGARLSDELLICVNRLAAHRGAPSAIAVLNGVHRDTGRFVFP